MTDEDLHRLARSVAETLADPDRKQLRFNDIVQCARDFYASDVPGGVRELTQSCDRASGLYVKKAPMWQTLRESYAWMLN
jgi:hypothetical protein